MFLKSRSHLLFLFKDGFKWSHRSPSFVVLHRLKRGVISPREMSHAARNHTPCDIAHPMMSHPLRCHTPREITKTLLYHTPYDVTPLEMPPPARCQTPRDVTPREIMNNPEMLHSLKCHTPRDNKQKPETLHRLKCHTCRPLKRHTHTR